tara:strand:- start:1565 stop:2251 length:687 start_codon:yes stop_codon:yes gene_type:complete
MTKKMLIVGVGSGLSASLAKIFRANGFSVGLVSRNIKNIESLGTEVNGKLFQCDVSNSLDVENLFLDIDESLGALDLVIFNPSKRAPGAIIDLSVDDVKSALDITCMAGFLVAQQAAKRMIKRGSGAIFFTGATASVKGFPRSSVFAMGKFGLRGLAQSLARELHPKNIHIGHIIIDGSIARFTGTEEENPKKHLDPDEIAKSYLQLFFQDKSTWSWELELRPWLENF